MPTIFKAITDLTPSIVINGTEQMEMVHNPGGPEEESQSVTVNQLAAAIGGGGGGQILAYVGAFPPSPPSNTNNPAIAYSADGSASTWYWNIASQNWM